MTPLRTMAALCVVAAAVAACGQTAASPSVPAAQATPSPPAAFSCEPRTLAFAQDIDLTGAWLGDDHGIYYLRQVGDTIWWNGMHLEGTDEATLGRGWNNVLHGTLDRDAMTISGDWADVPRGGAMNAGHLDITIVDDGGAVIEITKQQDLDGNESPGLFGGTRFTPCQELPVVR